MKIVIACRHGEAYKNLKNVYGGNGSSLTPNGMEQLEVLAKYLQKVCKHYPLPVALYASCDRVHIVESAKILTQALHLNTIYKDKNFCPIRLGVFDGMSRQNQLQLYPEACEAHTKWEQGLLDITESEKLVEGMQPASEYVNQVKTFLQNLPDNTISILLGTRSDLSCLQNIFNNQSPDTYMSYKYYDFGYAETTSAIIENNKIIKTDFDFPSSNKFDQKVTNNIDNSFSQ